jgi:hypothetical protein
MKKLQEIRAGLARRGFEAVFWGGARCFFVVLRISWLMLYWVFIDVLIWMLLAILFGEECIVLFVGDKIGCSRDAGLRAFFGEDPACFLCATAALIYDIMIIILFIMFV